MQISGRIRKNAKQTLHEKNKHKKNFLIKHNLRNIYQLLVVNLDISFWFENDLFFFLLSAIGIVTTTTTGINYPDTTMAHKGHSWKIYIYIETAAEHFWNIIKSK